MQAVPVTAEIARRAAALAWRDLPDDLVERTKQCLLDWFAVTVAGAQEELTGILVREAIEDGAKGPATLVGRNEKVLPSTAALINGAASHALDRNAVVAANPPQARTQFYGAPLPFHDLGVFSGDRPIVNDASAWNFDAGDGRNVRFDFFDLVRGKFRDLETVFDAALQ